MKKKCVGLIFGGKSSEHEISLQSAKNIMNEIDKKYFEVVLLEIDKQGQWHINDPSYYLLSEDATERISLNPSNISIAVVPGNTQGKVIDVNNGQILAKIDVVFPILHGRLGEDGSLQGMLRMTNFPFVGSDVLGSAACMDKDISKRLLRDAGLHVAPFITLTRANRDRFSFGKLSTMLELPLFVKPANQGSSIGVSKVIEETQFSQAINLAFKFDHKVVVEQGIIGREIECAVLGNDFPQASICGEVVFGGDFYSYDTKYIKNKGAQMVIPAVLNQEINDKIRSISMEAYRTLGCAGMARVDVFLTPNDDVIINEINTLPGFTSMSMYPKLWKASGINYQDLITRLIELAIERHLADSALKNSING